MNYLAIPDIAGMLMLMGVLAWLRSKYRDERVDLWLLGMFFILLEAAAVALYRGAFKQSAWPHALALDAYVLAGVTFGWAAGRDLVPGSWRLPLFVLPAVPMFALTTFYGFGYTQRSIYLGLGLASLLLGAIFIGFLRRSPVRFRLILVLIHLAIWGPLTALAWRAQLRWVVYWALTCLYLLVAFSFRGRVRRDAIGGIVIVTGFVIWAGCFFAHPMVRGDPVLGGIAEQIWNLQKFLVILGMLLTMLEDETDRRRAEAMHDSLTGLPNARLLKDRFHQAMERSRRSGRSAGLFMIDLNNFKQINDAEGHSAGDTLLRLTAQALQGVVRSSDTLARCGGDEFCVIINDLRRREDCDLVAEALRESVAAIQVPFRSVSSFSASVGYAVFPEDSADADEMYRLADQAMYRDKRAGATVSPVRRTVDPNRVLVPRLRE